MPCQLGPLRTAMAGRQRVWGSFVPLLSWKHFPNTVSLLWISEKRWAVRLKPSTTPGFFSDFWMQLIITEMKLISQARGKVLGDTLLTCSSHPREQQGGNRGLWDVHGCQKCQQVLSATALLLHGAGLHCQLDLETTKEFWLQQLLQIHVWWSGLPRMFYSSTSLLVTTLQWVWMLPKINTLQEGHPNPGLGGIALRWQLWHWIWPLNNVFSSSSCWEMKPKHFTSVF